MPRVGLEPTISAGERPQTYALGRSATGTGKKRRQYRRNNSLNLDLQNTPFYSVEPNFHRYTSLRSPYCVTFWRQNVPQTLRFIEDNQWNDYIQKPKPNAGNCPNFPIEFFKGNLSLQKPYKSRSDMTHVTRIAAFDAHFLTSCHVTERAEDRFCAWRSAFCQSSGYISVTLCYFQLNNVCTRLNTDFHTDSQFSHYSLIALLNFLCQHIFLIKHFIIQLKHNI